MLNRKQRTCARFAIEASTFLSNIFVIIGIAVAYLTYTQSIKSRQIDKSLHYITAFNEADMLNARNIIYRAWKGSKLSDYRVELTEAAVEEIVARMTADHDENGPEKDIKTAIVNIVTFFENAEACAKTGICNREILDAHIGSYASSFYCLYKGLIREEQENYNLPEFGNGLYEFARRHRGCHRQNL